MGPVIVTSPDDKVIPARVQTAIIVSSQINSLRRPRNHFGHDKGDAPVEDNDLTPAQ